MEAKEQKIEDMDVVKQLMRLMESQDMREQSQDYTEVIKYVAGMQTQLAAMADELHGVREQLAHMQADNPKSIKDSIIKKVEQLEIKMTSLSEKLAEVKDHLLETAAHAVSVFKEKGRQAMNKILRTEISSAQEALGNIKERMTDILTGYEKTANQIDSIGDELKQVGNSAANVGRLLSGKGTKDISDEKQGVALTRAINIPVKKAISRIKTHIDRIDHISEKLDKICNKLEPQKEADKGARVSVKEKLSEMKAKSEQQKKPPDMKKGKHKEECL